MDLVLGRVEVGDRVVAAVLPEDESVGAGAAGQHVGALAAEQHVVARAADQRVVPFAAEQHVVAFAALEPVGTLAAEQPVVALLAAQRVVALEPVHEVVGAVAVDLVVARVAIAPPGPGARQVEHVLGQVGLGNALQCDGAAAPGGEVDDRGRLVHFRRQRIVLDLRHCRLQVLPGHLLREVPEVDPVAGGIEVGDGVVAVPFLEDEDIATGSARHRVVAVLADDPVIAIVAAVEPVQREHAGSHVGDGGDAVERDGAAAEIGQVDLHAGHH